MELGNQQRRFGWFGGIVDGEGYLCIVKTQETRRKNPKYVPRFGIVNTDEKLIEAVMMILKETRVGFNRSDRPATKKWKKTMRIVVSGMKRCKKFLEVFGPYIYAKADRVELLKEFCDLRLSRPQRFPPTERELQIYNSLRVRNSRIHPIRSTITRATSSSVG